MNKKELRKAIIELPVDCSGLRPKIDQLTTLELIKLLGEPEKVKVPHFVAEWYEEHKESLEVSIFDYVYRINEKEKSVFKKWFVDSTTRPFQILVNMHQFGYEVEKEKRYRVKMKNLKTLFCYLARSKHDDYWSLIYSKMNGFYTTHTRKELEKAGFGWVFDCPGIEIEEVEE